MFFFFRASIYDHYCGITRSNRLVSRHFQSTNAEKTIKFQIENTAGLKRQNVEQNKRDDEQNRKKKKKKKKKKKEKKGKKKKIKKKKETTKKGKEQKNKKTKGKDQQDLGHKSRPPDWKAPELQERFFLLAGMSWSVPKAAMKQEVWVRMKV